MTTSELHSNWYPIASSTDAVERHVCHAQLLGREFAVWRADDGYVNVWENRCLHRGVRLSIGINDGSELVCRYHAWRYANRTAGCTYIPAHPADAPARKICNFTYPVQEAYGMIWAGEKAEGDAPALDGFDTFTVLRAVPINARYDFVQSELASFDFGADRNMATEANGAVTVIDADGTKAIFHVQPQDSCKSVIRGLLNRDLEGDDKISALRDYDERLQELRDAIEVKMEDMPIPETMEVTLPKASEDPPDYSVVPETGRRAELRLRVVAKTETAEGIVNLRLESIKGALPAYQPGAHIDLHLQNGLVRQYSLTNGPGETGYYSIGVKREVSGGGGSVNIHDNVAVGDVIATSAPRNNFPLRRDALKTILVAGGIGITPLLSMSQTLHNMDLNFGLHYFVQSDDYVAFKETIAALGDTVTLHKGLTPNETNATLNDVLKSPGFATHLYICGPGPMLSSAREIATKNGWPEETVHFEYFKNDTEIDKSAEFTIELARSALTFDVPSGKTILEVLRENGVNVPSSCEQGACGTCKVGLIEGDVDHHDVYLAEGQKSAGDAIMTCVSRAKSGRLILDL